MKMIKDTIERHIFVIERNIETNLRRIQEMNSEIDELVRHNESYRQAADEAKTTLQMIEAR